MDLMTGESLESSSSSRERREISDLYDIYIYILSDIGKSESDVRHVRTCGERKYEDNKIRRFAGLPHVCGP